MTSIALAFHETNFSIVDHKGQIWLRAPELAHALTYADQSSVNRIYARHSDEFTDGMTASVKLTDPCGDLQETRIFSLRGCHLIAMFARTAVAKEFRRWVLDILDREVLGQAINKRLTISPEQQAELHSIVEDRAGGNRKVFAEMWSRHNRHFKVAKYNQLLAVHFEDAKQYLASMELRSKLELAVVPQDAFSMMFGETRHQVADYMHKIQKQVVELGGTLPSYPAFDNDAIAATVIGSIVQSRRMFLTFGMDGKPNVSFIPSDCYVIRDEDFPKVIADREGVNKSLLPDIMQSVMKRLGLANK